jgi:hypothetical protein
MADIWREYLGTANKELIDYARRLRPRYRTGILSNSFVGARQREQAAYGFEDLVDEIVYSYEVGMSSPIRGSTPSSVHGLTLGLRRRYSSTTRTGASPGPVTWASTQSITRTMPRPSERSRSYSQPHKRLGRGVSRAHQPALPRSAPDFLFRLCSG